jgi:hypothetical protein
MYSYNPGEGNDWQFPFPNYENGDIFLSWGSVAVKAYAAYKPELAVKYVKNVLAQYAKDGLAFQRYGRLKQDGLGDDILSGNSLSVVGLYQAIYGINPLYNRFYLEPHITPELAGTQLNYKFRDQKLVIDLEMNKYAVSNDRFKIISKTNFGFFNWGNDLFYFNGSKSAPSMKVKTAGKGQLSIDMKQWSPAQISWSQISKDTLQNKLAYQLFDLKPNSFYSVSLNGKTFNRVKTNLKGVLNFDCEASENPTEIVVINR